jgi:hexosaminidase
MKYLKTFIVIFCVVSLRQGLSQTLKPDVKNIPQSEKGTNKPVIIPKGLRPEVKIIPQPAMLTNLEGTFIITPKTKILINSGYIITNRQIKEIGSILKRHLESFYGMKNFLFWTGNGEENSIFINYSDLIVGKEAYHLSVTPKGVLLEASTPNGLFYGVQTLIQLMPPSKQQLTEVVLPAVDIKDAPRFPWRGQMLDVSRHFFPKEFVLKFIDYMAMHKFNTFVWHLNDDQGWRIEIKKYPKLTEIGSVRKESVVERGPYPKRFDGTPYGGFYTQEDVKEIVAYATERYIAVVPEIETFSHSSAILASYPELGCTGGPYEVGTHWGVRDTTMKYGVYEDVLCAGKEKTFEFLQDVITEILPLFRQEFIPGVPLNLPSEYFHIGGDENPKSAWRKCPLCQKRMKEEGLKDVYELQSYFVRRVTKFLNENGKKVIGWEEIMEGGLAPDAAVMAWRGVEAGIDAAQQHHFVVMATGMRGTLERVYGFDPIPVDLTADEVKYILGAQRSGFSEGMKTPQDVESRFYPSAAVIAEVLWSPKKPKDYANFKDRMLEQIKRYDAYGINYSKAELK